MNRTLSAIVKTSACYAFLFATATTAPAKDLNIYTWADYFGAETIEQHKKQTGVNIRLDYYDSNEVLETKMLTGSSGYDVVFPATSNAAREFQAGALATIDTDRLSNYANLNPAILSSLDKVEGGRKIGVPYTWGTIGIAYNVAEITKRLGEQRMDTLDVLFKPEIAEKLKECGIAMLDSPLEITSIALNYVGADPYSNDNAELKKAENVLSTAAKSVRYFHNQKATNDLAGGDLCVALIYSGDAGLAAARAAETGSGVEIAYAIPKEGTLMWIDLMAIPADAPNPDEAYRFLDYLLEPQVIADVTNTVYFANANLAANEFIDKAILSDPGVYPTDEVFARLFPDLSIDLRGQRGRTRLWTRVRTGR